MNLACQTNINHTNCRERDNPHLSTHFKRKAKSCAALMTGQTSRIEGVPPS
jgi:hypothetical protein